MRYPSGTRSRPLAGGGLRPAVGARPVSAEVLNRRHNQWVRALAVTDEPNSNSCEGDLVAMAVVALRAPHRRRTVYTDARD
jgi:hypothetical protein